MKKHYIAPTAQAYRLASGNLMATSIDVVTGGSNEITNSDLNQSGGAWSNRKNDFAWTEDDTEE